MKQREKKSFILYGDFSELFGLLSLEERGRLITAIFNYENAGAEDDGLSDAAKMAFICIKNTLDRDRAAYEDKCEKNAENGRKGGRPRKKAQKENTEADGREFFSEKTERLFSKPKKADSDNDSGTDSGTDSENDFDIDSGADSGTDSGTDNYNYCSAYGSAFHLSEAVSDDAPRERDRYKKELISEGIPERYIAEREARADSYALKHGKNIESVLREWWAKENLGTKKRYGYEPPKPEPLPPGYFSESSFDVDEFFAAALERSRRSMSGG